MATHRPQRAGSGGGGGLDSLAASIAGAADLHPVLNEEYATKIARDWNVKNSGAGFVTRFRVRKSFMDRYSVQQVGGRTILEYWIPAEDLAELNANIVGTIEVVAEYD